MESKHAEVNSLMLETQCQANGGWLCYASDVIEAVLPGRLGAALEPR